MRRPEADPVRRLVVERHEPSGAPSSRGEEAVAVEGPLEVRISGEAFSVTMSSPGQDAILARGLLFSEGVVADHAWYPSTQQARDCALGSRVIDLAVPADAVQRPETERRLAATSSCGLCGAASLEGLDAGLERRLSPTPFDADAVPGWFATMSTHQAAFAAAGGTHAAAAFDAAGGCLAVHEDIGRHNAVDKVIGALIRGGHLEEATVLAVSGRVSFEIMAKAMRAEIPTVAAVSAPSSLAIDLARRSGMALLAFCRGRRFTVYHGAQAVAQRGGFDVRIVA